MRQIQGGNQQQSAVKPQNRQRGLRCIGQLEGKPESSTTKQGGNGQLEFRESPLGRDSAELVFKNHVLIR